MVRLDNFIDFIFIINYCLRSKLKKLCIKNLDGAFNKEFISILLEDHIQGLEVEGVDHLSEETLRRVEERILAESKANQAMKEMKY